MVVVAITTIDWGSIKRIRQVPITDTIVMITTIVIVLMTHNLAYGVIVGIILSALFFASKVSHVEVMKENQGDTTIYEVSGQLFFASTTSFMEGFNYVNDRDNVVINCKNMKVWDESAVEAIDKVVLRYQRNGKAVKIIQLSPDSQLLVERMAMHNKS